MLHISCLNPHIGMVLVSCPKKVALGPALGEPCVIRVPFDFLVEHVFVPRFCARVRVVSYVSACQVFSYQTLCVPLSVSKIV